jgi:hypothetical protein
MSLQLLASGQLHNSLTSQAAEGIASSSASGGIAATSGVIAGIEGNTSATRPGIEVRSQLLANISQVH